MKLQLRFLNPALCALVGGDRGTLTGRPIAEVLKPVEEEPSGWPELANLGVREWAFRFRNKQGQTYHLTATATPQASRQGVEPLILVFLQDSSEHVQLKRLLEQHEHSFEHLASNMPGMIYKFVLTRDGQAAFPYASPGCQDLWEIDPATVRQDAGPILKLVHPDDFPAFQESVMQSAARLSPWEFEGRMITPSGKLKWWHAASRPELAENGDIVWQGLLMDITRQKQIEEELKIAKHKAESAARAKADFLANMSHEIRTPMNGVIGMAELLSHSELAPRQKHYVETIRSSAEVLLTIINDILDLSKMEAGKLVLNPAIFDLRRTVEDVAALLAPRAFEKGLELIVRYDPQVPSRVQGDPVRIRQILTNLIGNAIKFTASGHVLVQIQELGRAENRAQLAFSVTDTGIGISPETVDRIFEKFEQADTSTARKFGGTGLGLAISRQLVELMGGKIEVESQLNRGSTFRFTLDLPVRDEAPGTEVAPSQLNRLKVLVVDDHAVNRELLGYILTAWGVPHGEAASGEAALSTLRQAAAEHQPYDLVLLDFQMPGMDGLLLAAAIRAEPAISDVALVMFSSSSFTDDQQRKLAEAGVAAQLLKPLRQFELRQVLLETQSRRAPPPQEPTTEKPVLASPLSQLKVDEQFGLSVLLAEDNEVNREIAMEMLKSLGCSADHAANGLQAVAMARKQRYDLILMDCQMPEMDGFDATKMIRQFEDGRSVVIVAMTARAMAGDKESCLATGMDDYLAKPVTFDELRRVVALCASKLRQRNGSARNQDRAETKDSAAVAPTIPALATLTLDKTPAHPAGSQIAPPLFDLAAALAVTGGRTEVLRKAMDIWWQRVPDWLTNLKVAVQKGDLNQIRHTCHTMRGAASNIGALSVSQRAERIETSAQEERLEAVSTLFDHLVVDIERLRQVTLHIDWAAQDAANSHQAPV